MLQTMLLPLAPISTSFWNPTVCNGISELRIVLSCWEQQRQGLKTKGKGLRTWGTKAAFPKHVGLSESMTGRGAEASCSLAETSFQQSLQIWTPHPAGLQQWSDWLNIIQMP